MTARRAHGRAATPTSAVVESKPKPKPRVRVAAFATFADASGAAAKMSWEGYTFVFGLSGTIKIHLVSIPRGGSGARAKVAELLCTHAFLTRLERAVDADWLERNVRMHARKEAAKS